MTKLGHFFQIFEKGQGRPPPSPSSYASVYIPDFICVENMQLKMNTTCYVSTVYKTYSFTFEVYFVVIFP